MTTLHQLPLLPPRCGYGHTGKQDFDLGQRVTRRHRIAKVDTARAWRKRQRREWRNLFRED